MNNFNKYFGLLTILIGSLVGFVLLIIILFYILKFFAITLFIIPGFNQIYRYLIIAVPYLIFFSGYNYLRKKISFSKSKPSRVIARGLILTGGLICFVSLIFATLKFGGVKNDLLNTFDENSQYVLILQLIIIIITAGVIATGDPKEKDWMERSTIL